MSNHNRKLLDIHEDRRFVSTRYNVCCQYFHVYTGVMEEIEVFGHKQECQRVDLWWIIAN